MQSLGLLELAGARGLIVKEFGRDELQNLYDVRCWLETAAIRKSYRRMDPNLLDEVLKEVHALANWTSHSSRWKDRALDVDRRLHDVIASHCDNERLTWEIWRYRNLVEVIRQAMKTRNATLDLALEEHRAILNALRKGTSQQASRAMETHIHHSADIAADALFPDQ